MNQNQNQQKENQENLKKHLQSKFIEFQTLEQQMQIGQQQLQKVDAQIMEIHSIIQGLTDLQGATVEEEMLVPISSGIFVKGILKKKDEFVVNVGSSVLVNKSFSDTVDILKDQITEIENFRNDLLAQLQQISLKTQFVEKELQVMMGNVEN